MDKLSIYEIVTKLCGDIVPVGESYGDEKRLSNLQTTIELVDTIISEIEFVRGYKHNQAYSEQRIGVTADDFLRDMYEQLKDYYIKGE